MDWLYTLFYNTIHRPVCWFDKSDESIFFFLVFFLEKTASYFIVQTDLGTFSDGMFFNKSFCISLHIAPIDRFFWTSFHFFFFRLSYSLTRYLSDLTLELSAIY